MNIMFYKVTNKESEAYQKLHELRTKELRIEKQNYKLLKEKIPQEFDAYSGYKGQQNWGRITYYKSFRFTDKESVDLKVWRESKDNPGFYIPNRRSKAGKDMSNFLVGLQSSSLQTLLNILELDRITSFKFPYLEICHDGTLVLFLDRQWRVDTTCFIEITETEALERINKKK